jgi:hypothetical protein
LEVHLFDLDDAELARSARLRRNLDDGDLVVLRWPSQSAERDLAAFSGQARLLLVAPDASPPQSSDVLEDWVRLPLDAAELESRRAQLMYAVDRARPAVLEEHGLVRRGRRWVDLSPQQEQLFALLLQNVDQVVRRPALMAAMDAEGADASQRLDHAMRRLRIRLHPLGLTIGTIRGVGFVLELGSPPDT